MFFAASQNASNAYYGIPPLIISDRFFPPRVSVYPVMSTPLIVRVMSGYIIYNVCHWLPNPYLQSWFAEPESKKGLCLHSPRRQEWWDADYKWSARVLTIQHMPRWVWAIPTFQLPLVQTFALEDNSALLLYTPLFAKQSMLTLSCKLSIDSPSLSLMTASLKFNIFIHNVGSE